MHFRLYIYQRLRTFSKMLTLNLLSSLIGSYSNGVVDATDLHSYIANKWSDLTGL